MFFHSSLFPIALLTLSASLYAQSTRSTAQLTPVGAVVPGRYLVVYGPSGIPDNAAAQLQASGATLLQHIDRFGIAVVSASAANASALSLQSNIESVLEDRIVTATATPTAIVTPVSGALGSAPGGAVGNPDALYASSRGWAVRQAGGFGTGFGGGTTQGPWNTTQGQNIRIAMLDSGVDASHPDIAPNLGLNLSEVDQNPQTGLPSPCDDGTPQDQQGHGTWTASLAAGALGPRSGLVAGVAPAATLLNIKVLERLPHTAGDASTCPAGEAAGLFSWVIEGIDAAISNHADIVSMSFGTLVDRTAADGLGIENVFSRVTHTAANAGVILIAAAGNDGMDLSAARYVHIPSESSDVLAIVSATNPDCAENLNAGATCAPGPVTLPYYSNHGVPLHALAAPGGSHPSQPGTGSSADSALATGWIQGACSAGKPNTTDGAPVDAAHSFGCFGLGHVQYVLAMGTSAAAPLAAGAAALVRAAHPAWPAASVVEALRATAVTLPNHPVPQLNTAAALALP